MRPRPHQLQAPHRPAGDLAEQYRRARQRLEELRRDGRTLRTPEGAEQLRQAKEAVAAAGQAWAARFGAAA